MGELAALGVPGLAEKKRRSQETLHPFWAVYREGGVTPVGCVCLYADCIEGDCYNLLDLWLPEEEWDCSFAEEVGRTVLEEASRSFQFYAIALLAQKKENSLLSLAVALGMYFYRKVRIRDGDYELYQYVHPLPCRAYGPLSAQFYDLHVTIASVAEVNFYESRFRGLEAGVLEPMCGSGRLLLPLLARGIAIEGFDNSSIMLQRCRDRAGGLSLAPQLYEGDILAFDLKKRYSAVVIPLGSLQFLAGPGELFVALQQLHAHLLPGGRLFFDAYIPDWSIVGSKKNLLFHQEMALPEGGTITGDSKVAVCLPKQFLTLRKIYRKFTLGQLEAEEVEELTAYWYFRFELEQLLERAGFKLVAVHRRPYQDYECSNTYEAIVSELPL